MLLPTELDVEFCNATIEEISEYSEIYIRYTGRKDILEIYWNV